MIPKASEGMQDIVIKKQPSRSYQLQIKDSTVQGYTDGKPAMEQAIYKILNTERYQDIIYSWRYGVELSDLFGKPIPFVIVELPRRIGEALLQDDRVLQVENFSFSRHRQTVIAVFTVKTTEGDIVVEKAVKV